MSYLTSDFMGTGPVESKLSRIFFDANENQTGITDLAINGQTLNIDPSANADIGYKPPEV